MPHNTLPSLGGEEFVIICPDTDLQGCKKLAEQLKKQIAAYPFAHTQKLTASLGIACYQKDETANDIINRVDKALYRAKQLGRNRIEIG